MRPRREGNRNPNLTPAGAFQTKDGLLNLDRPLHDLLEKAGKKVRMEIYEGGYHDFVMGPQGQKRPYLPDGEALLDITLQAYASIADGRAHETVKTIEGAAPS